MLLQALDALSRASCARCTSPARSPAPRSHGARVAGSRRLAGARGRRDQLERSSATIAVEHPAVCVIDSIQTVYASAHVAPGSVAQVRECAAQSDAHEPNDQRRRHRARRSRDQGGRAAGRACSSTSSTRSLYFEGDTHSSFRPGARDQEPLRRGQRDRAVCDDRAGLKGVGRQPSAIFLSTHGEPVAGSCVLVTLEGTRPMLVEIQALVDRRAEPRRLSVGLERDRLRCRLAVLHRHAASRASTRTCSSMRSAACASASRGRPRGDARASEQLARKPLPAAHRVRRSRPGRPVRPAPRGEDRPGSQAPAFGGRRAEAMRRRRLSRA